MVEVPHDLGVGRERELSHAVELVEALVAGPAALLIQGDAGIGKTTLWRAVQREAARRGHRVMSTTAVDHESDLPFVALRDLLEPLPAQVSAGLPALQRHALDVALLRVSDPEGVADQHAVSVAVLEVIRAAAAESPVLIAVDDVVWLDRSSERVLRYVFRRLTTERVGVMAARRSGTDHVVPLGLDHGVIQERLLRLDLGPLDPEQTFALLDRGFGRSLPRRVLRTIYAVAQGNPFYAVEIARAVQRTGTPVLTADALPVPGRLQALTEARLGSLKSEVRDVLAVVATLSRPTPALVTHAVGPHAVESMERAADEGLLALGDAGVRFAHPLLRSAAIASLSIADRRALHRRLAAVVTDPDERVVHLAAAAIGPDESVAAGLMEAAHRALARGAPEAAAALASRSTSLTPADSPERAGRAVRTAEYLYRAEDVVGAEARLTEVIGLLPAGELRAEALLWLATVRQAQSGMAEAADLAARALAEADSPGLRAAAERHLALALVVTGDAPGGDRHAAAALNTALATGDPTSVAESQAVLAWTQFWVGRGLRRELLDAARSVTPWTRFAPHESSPNVVAGLLLSWADEIEEARSVLVEEDRRLTELGQDRPRAVVLFNLSELECRAGNWDAAERLAREGHQTAVLAGDEFSRALLLYARGLVLAHRGQVDSARADGEQAIAVGREVGTPVPVLFGTALLGFLALSAGDVEQVHRHLGPLAAHATAHGGFDPGLARFVPDEVEALLALGEPVAAGELLDRFQAQAVALDRPWALAAAHRCRGLLLADSGDLDAAASALEQALAAHARVDLPFERARTLLAAGMVHRRARRRREARELLQEALDEFTRLGAVAWVVRAEAERARIGGRAPSAGTLTEAERRIAELVASGRSNREVAAALFLSVSTVEAALSKIYRKLAVRSRTELSARFTGPD